MISIRTIKIEDKKEKPAKARPCGFKGWLRVTALITLVTFTFETVCQDYAYAARPIVTPSRFTDDLPETSNSAPRPFSIADFQLPPYLGEIRDKYISPSGRTAIIHIQDAHCNYAAQKKIAKIIKYLNTIYGINQINLEGGEGEYKLSIFTDIENPDVRRRVADSFMKEGEIGGAEFYAIINPGRVNLWGVETPRLYIGNLDIYRRVAGEKETIDRLLDNLSHLLNLLKTRIFSKELIYFDTEYRAFRNDRLDFRRYIRYLADLARQNSVELRRYEGISSLLQTMAFENEIDFKKANEERNRLINILQRGLSKEELEELVAKTVQFKFEKISQEEFYGYLIHKARCVGVDVEKFPNLRGYKFYSSAYETIDKTELFEEVESLEEDLKDQLAATSDQKELLRLSKTFEIMKGMLNIQLTKKDYEYYLRHKTDFKAQNFIKFFNKNSDLLYRNSIDSRFRGNDNVMMSSRAREPKATESRDLNIIKLTSYIKRIERFYKYSFKRDRAFLKNIKFSKERHRASRSRVQSTLRLRSGQAEYRGREEAAGQRVRGHGPQATVLITGGFHTENLRELMRERNIPYVSIIPRFRNSPEYKSPYFRILGGKLSEEGKSVAQRLGISMIAIASIFSSLGERARGREEYITSMLMLHMKIARAESKKGIKVISGEGEWYFDVDWTGVDPAEVSSDREFETVFMPELAEALLTDRGGRGLNATEGDISQIGQRMREVYEKETQYRGFSLWPWRRKKDKAVNGVIDDLLEIRKRGVMPVEHFDKSGLARTEEARFAVLHIYQRAINRAVEEMEKIGKADPWIRENLELRWAGGSVLKGRARLGIFPTGTSFEDAVMETHFGDRSGHPSDIDLYIDFRKGARAAAEDKHNRTKAKSAFDLISRRIYEEMGIYVSLAFPWEWDDPDTVFPACDIKEVKRDGLIEHCRKHRYYGLRPPIGKRISFRGFVSPPKGWLPYFLAIVIMTSFAIFGFNDPTPDEFYAFYNRNSASFDEHAGGYLVSRTILGITRAIFKHPPLFTGIIIGWALIAFAVGYSLYLHKKDTARRMRKTVKAGRKTPIAFALLFINFIIAVFTINYRSGWILDEAFYLEALVTVVQSGKGWFLPNITGSLFFWPALMLFTSHMGKYFLGSVFLTRLLTVGLTTVSTYIVYRISGLLSDRWKEKTNIPEWVLEWMPVFSIPVIGISASVIFNSVYATYNPLSVFLLVNGLYHLIKGIERDRKQYLWLSGILFVASFGTRYYNLLVHLPFILAIAIYLSLNRNNFRRTFKYFILPFAVLGEAFVSLTWIAVKQGIWHAFKLSEEFLLCWHRPIMDIIAEALRYTSPAVLIAAGGLLLLNSSSKKKERAESFLWAGVFSILAGHVWRGYIFSIGKNLSLMVMLYAPFAGLALSWIIYEAKTRYKRVGLYVIFSALIAFTSYSLRYAFGFQRNLRDHFWLNVNQTVTWLKENVRPPAGSRVINIGGETNPWAMKAFENWKNNGVFVESEKAFRDMSFKEYLDMDAEIYHLARKPTEAEVRLIKHRGYRIYKVPESDRLFESYLFIKKGITVKTKGADGESGLSPRIGKRAEVRTSTLRFTWEDRSKAEVDVYKTGTEEKLGTLELELKKGRDPVESVRREIEQMRFAENSHKELILSMLSLFEKSPPRGISRPAFYVFDTAIKDLFGFAVTPAPGNTGLVALHKDFAGHPLPAFHEMMEYLLDTGQLQLELKAGIAGVLSRAGFYRLLKWEAWPNGELIVRVRKREVGRVTLKGDSLSIALKALKAPGGGAHYLLRALQRQVFGQKDVSLTRRIKELQMPAYSFVLKTHRTGQQIKMASGTFVMGGPSHGEWYVSLEHDDALPEIWERFHWFLSTPELKNGSAGALKALRPLISYMLKLGPAYYREKGLWFFYDKLEHIDRDLEEIPSDVNERKQIAWYISDAFQHLLPETLYEILTEKLLKHILIRSKAFLYLLETHIKDLDGLNLKFTFNLGTPMRLNAEDKSLEVDILTILNFDPSDRMFDFLVEVCHDQIVISKVIEGLEDRGLSEFARDNRRLVELAMMALLNSDYINRRFDYYTAPDGSWKKDSLEELYGELEDIGFDREYTSLLRELEGRHVFLKRIVRIFSFISGNCPFIEKGKLNADAVINLKKIYEIAGQKSRQIKHIGGERVRKEETPPVDYAKEKPKKKRLGKHFWRKVLALAGIPLVVILLLYYFWIASFRPAKKEAPEPDAVSSLKKRSAPPADLIRRLRNRDIARSDVPLYPAENNGQQRGKPYVYEYVPPVKLPSPQFILPEDKADEEGKWVPLAKSAGLFKPRGQGALARITEWLGREGKIPVVLEIISSREDIRGQIFYDELFDGLGPGGIFYSEGVSISTEGTDGPDTVKVRVKIPPLRKGEKVPLYTLFWKVIRLPDLGGKLRLRRGIYLEAQEDIPEDFILEYELLEAADRDNYIMIPDPMPLTEHMLREFEVLTNSPVERIRDIRNMLDAVKDEDIHVQIETVRKILRKYFVYIKYFNAGLKPGGTYFGWLADVLNEEGKFRAECDTISIFSWLMFRYLGIETVYMTGRFSDDGHYVFNVPGHALFVISDGRDGWIKFDSTRFLPAEEEYTGKFMKKREGPGYLERLAVIIREWFERTAEEEGKRPVPKKEEVPERKKSSEEPEDVKSEHKAGYAGYTTRQGDELSRIGFWFYGDVLSYGDIHTANRDKLPPLPENYKGFYMLPPDVTLVIPDATVLEHTVKKGETLYDIAVEYYGDTGYYRKEWPPYRRIVGFNRLENPGKIYPGQVLKIPISCRELKERQRTMDRLLYFAKKTFHFGPYDESIDEFRHFIRWQYAEVLKKAVEMKEMNGYLRGEAFAALHRRGAYRQLYELALKRENVQGPAAYDIKLSYETDSREGAWAGGWYDRFHSLARNAVDSLGYHWKHSHDELAAVFLERIVENESLDMGLRLAAATHLLFSKPGGGFDVSRAGNLTSVFREIAAKVGTPYWYPYPANEWSDMSCLSITALNVLEDYDSLSGLVPVFEKNLENMLNLLNSGIDISGPGEFSIAELRGGYDVRYLAEVVHALRKLVSLHNNGRARDVLSASIPFMKYTLKKGKEHRDFRVFYKRNMFRESVLALIELTKRGNDEAGDAIEEVRDYFEKKIQTSEDEEETRVLRSARDRFNRLLEIGGYKPAAGELDGDKTGEEKQPGSVGSKGFFASLRPGYFFGKWRKKEGGDRDEIVRVLEKLIGAINGGGVEYYTSSIRTEGVYFSGTDIVRAILFPENKARGRQKKAVVRKRHVLKWRDLNMCGSEEEVANILVKAGYRTDVARAFARLWAFTSTTSGEGEGMRHHIGAEDLLEMLEQEEGKRAILQTGFPPQTITDSGAGTFHDSVLRVTAESTHTDGWQSMTVGQPAPLMGKRAEIDEKTITLLWPGNTGGVVVVRNSVTGKPIRSLIFGRTDTERNPVEDIGRDIGNMEFKDSSHREMVNEILKLFEHSPPRFYTFSNLIEDLFGFASQKKGFIALHKALENNSIAMFHEICEYAIKADLLSLDLQDRTLLISVKSGRTFRLRLGDEALAIAGKTGTHPTGQMRGHYLLRALAREVFGEKDRELTKRIRCVSEVRDILYKRYNREALDYFADFLDISYVLTRLVEKYTYEVHPDGKVRYKNTVMDTIKWLMGYEIANMLSMEDWFNLGNFFMDVLEFCDDFKTNTEARELLESLAVLHAQNEYRFSEDNMYSDEAARYIRENPVPGTGYLDLTSGEGFQPFMDKLNPETRYILVDKHPFVVKFLREMAHLLDARNVEVIEEDVRKLKRPSIPLGVIRVKNSASYVPGLADKLKEMREWLVEGGRFVIQNDGEEGLRTDMLNLAPLIKELIEKGWAMEFEEGRESEDIENVLLTTIVFTKPGRKPLRDTPPAGEGTPPRIGRRAGIAEKTMQFTTNREYGEVKAVAPRTREILGTLKFRRKHENPLKIIQKGIDRMEFKGNAHKEMMDEILSLFELSPPELYVFNNLFKDLFAFASPENNLIAVHHSLIDDSVALFHEVCEYAVRTGLLSLDLKGDTLLVSVKFGKQFRLQLEGEALAIARKSAKYAATGGSRDHYLLRALAREVFAGEDRDLTTRLKSMFQINELVHEKYDRNFLNFIEGNIDLFYSLILLVTHYTNSRLVGISPEDSRIAASALMIKSIISITHEGFVTGDDLMRLHRIFVDILEFCDGYKDDREARKFLENLGVLRAQHVYRRLEDNLFSAKAARYISENPVAGTGYLDLATGVNFFGFMDKLDPNTEYMVVDNDPFVAKFLGEMKRLMNVQNVNVIEEDVMKLEKPEVPLGVIRAKNVVSFVPGIVDKLKEMADWLAEGGRLVIQAEPKENQLKRNEKILDPLFRELVARGWDFRFEKGYMAATATENIYHTWIFTKPYSPRSVPAGFSHLRKTGQIGHEAYIDGINREKNRALVRNLQGEVQFIDIRRLGPVKSSFLAACFETVKDEANMQVAAEIVRFFAATYPEFYVYHDFRAGDVFGWALKGQNMVIIPGSFLNNPVAVFRKIVEHLINEESLALKMQDSHLCVSLGGEKKFVVSLGKEALAVERKGGSLVDVFTRELYGKNDRELGQRVRCVSEVYKTIYAGHSHELLRLLGTHFDMIEVIGQLMIESAGLSEADPRRRYELAAEAVIANLAHNKEFCTLTGKEKDLKNMFIDIINFCDNYASAPAAERFLRNMGIILAQDIYWQRALLYEEAVSGVTKNPLPGTVYLDLATGINFCLLMRNLDPETRYVLVDKNPFAAEVLRNTARLYGVSNVTVIEEDLARLRKPEVPLGVIRAKNVAVYVPGFTDKLAEMTRWLEPGGQLVIQADYRKGQLGAYLREINPVLQRLISENWSVEFKRAEKTRPGSLHTLTFTKPEGAFTGPGHLQREEPIQAIDPGLFRDLRNARHISHEAWIERIDARKGEAIVRNIRGEKHVFAFSPLGRLNLSLLRDSFKDAGPRREMISAITDLAGHEALAPAFVQYYDFSAGDVFDLGLKPYKLIAIHTAFTHSRVAIFRKVVEYLMIKEALSMHLEGRELHVFLGRDRRKFSISLNEESMAVIMQGGSLLDALSREMYGDADRIFVRGAKCMKEVYGELYGRYSHRLLDAIGKRVDLGKVFYGLMQTYLTYPKPDMASAILLEDAAEIFNQVSEDLGRNVQDRIEEMFGDILRFCEGYETDTRARRYIENLGRLKALCEWRHVKEAPRKIPSYLETDAGTAHLELATGTDLCEYMGNLPPDVTYIVVDKSPYAVKAVQETARLLGATNVKVIEQDVMKFEKPEIPVGSIRIKNIAAYVPGFRSKLREMAGWIKEGGTLVIQADPGENRFEWNLSELEPVPLDLIKSGWGAEFTKEADERGERVVYALTFTKPCGSYVRDGVSEAAALEQLKRGRQEENKAFLSLIRESRQIGHKAWMEDIDFIEKQRAKAVMRTKAGGGYTVTLKPFNRSDAFLARLSLMDMRHTRHREVLSGIAEFFQDCRGASVIFTYYDDFRAGDAFNLALKIYNTIAVHRDFMYNRVAIFRKVVEFLINKEKLFLKLEGEMLHIWFENHEEFVIPLGEEALSVAKSREGSLLDALSRAIYGREDRDLKEKMKCVAETHKVLYGRYDGALLGSIQEWGSLTDTVSRLVQWHLYDPDAERVTTEMMDRLIDRYPEEEERIRREIYAPCKSIFEDILMFTDSYETDPEARRFLEDLAAFRALDDYGDVKKPLPQISRYLAGHAAPGTVYLDLAAGPDFYRYMGSLKPEITYMVVDKSPFVTRMLRDTARLLGVRNVRVVEQDIMKLEKPEMPVGVIRAKNLLPYIKDTPELMEKLEEMTEWLIDGGQLVVQSEPFEKGLTDTAREFHPLFEKLIEGGWDFKFRAGSMSRDPAERLFHTFILTKHGAAGTVAQMGRRARVDIETIRLSEDRSRGKVGVYDPEARQPLGALEFAREEADPVRIAKEGLKQKRYRHSAHREMIARIFDYLGAKTPDLYIFDSPVKDLFGFSSSRPGHRLVALYKEFADNPIALFHEIFHFWMGDDADRPWLLDLGLEGANTIVISARKDESREFTEIGRVVLTDTDAVRQLGKAPGNSHYLLRALAREIFADQDRELTQKLKTERFFGGIIKLKENNLLATEAGEVLIIGEMVDVLGLSRETWRKSERELLQNIVMDDGRNLMRYIREYRNIYGKNIPGILRLISLTKQEIKARGISFGDKESQVVGRFFRRMEMLTGRDLPSLPHRDMPGDRPGNTPRVKEISKALTEIMSRVRHPERKVIILMPKPVKSLALFNKIMKGWKLTRRALWSEYKMGSVMVRFYNDRNIKDVVQKTRRDLEEDREAYALAYVKENMYDRIKNEIGGLPRIPCIKERIDSGELGLTMISTHVVLALGLIDYLRNGYENDDQRGILVDRIARLLFLLTGGDESVCRQFRENPESIFNGLLIKIKPFSEELRGQILAVEQVAKSL